MGLRKGISWPDNDVMETLPKIIKNLSKIGAPTGFELWMIITNETKEVIGDVGFKGFNEGESNVDIGYGIIIGERRQGYAEEGVKALIIWAFAHDIIKEITAKCFKENTSSIHLLHKLNFKEIKKDDIFLFWSLSRSSLANELESHFIPILV